MKGKTQVFIDPAGDHYRTRMTHTLETTGIARVVARALRLNEDLVEAIGLGHDTGHTPFGHAGEEALDEALRERFGGHFRHNEQSHRIAERLNLTYEVRDGILTHTGDASRRRSREDRPDRRSRGVHQPRHRRRDPVRDPRGGRPSSCRDRGARQHRWQRIDTLVHDLVECSAREGDIAQSDEVGSAMLALRTFMFERVYLGPDTRAEHERARVTIRRIFDRLADGGDDPEGITEFIAGMTDRFALAYARTL